MKEFKKDLIKANELRTIGNHKEALKYFEKCYKEHPEAFSNNQKIDYGWTLYKVKIANFKDEAELFEAAEFVSEMLSQMNLNINTGCPYTSSVFGVLDHLDDEKDYSSMFYWLEKINPDLLSDKPFRKYGILLKSKKEKYYDWASKAYFETGDYEKCIEVSKTALNSIKKFRFDGDAWYNRRIAKSLVELNRLKEALIYFKEVIKVKHEWYIYREIAEVYYLLNKPFDALDYLCPAVLSKDSPKEKVNVYLLVFRVLNGFNPEMALPHAQLYYLLKMEGGHYIESEIRDLGIDESSLNRKELISWVNDVWTQYKFKNQKKQYGTVSKFFNDRNFGFIRTEDDNSIFFHRNEFDGQDIFIGQIVSFYTEKSFDKSKNQESTVAVHIKSE